MKLYLSSNGVGAEPDRLREMVRPQGHAGIIFNARDAHGNDRIRHRRREFRDIAKLGLQCDELDLRDYFNDHDGLADRLKSYDLLWVIGGNSFVLARAMNQSGFADAIAPYLDRHLVYAGYSAGACVTGPDLVGCHLIDEPDALPEGYDPIIGPVALGWVPWRIVPHWRSDHGESELAESAATYLSESGLEHRLLRDGEVIVIDAATPPSGTSS